MIVWGGSGMNNVLRYGAAFNPDVNRWVQLRTIGKIPRRLMHSSILVGNKLILWGGASTDLLDGVGKSPSGITIELDQRLLGPQAAQDPLP